ncbi:MAG: 50S ribosomal protein L4 [Solirubrobacterales bacterium]
MADLTAPYLGKTGTVKLAPEVFGEEFDGALVHEVVRAERNALRGGNASTKTRGQVAMTGAKAWRQKGTGRARVGALSTVHRRGGGVTFGPTPRSYTFKVNRKVRRKAFRAALSLHAERGSLAIIPSGAYSEPATKDAAANLSKWNDKGSVVVITSGEGDANTAKSFRNIGRVRAVLPTDAIGVYELTAAQSVVISEDALEALTALASKDIKRDSKKPVVAVKAGKRNKTLVKGQKKGAAENAAADTSSSQAADEASTPAAVDAVEDAPLAESENSEGGEE